MRRWPARLGRLSPPHSGSLITSQPRQLDCISPGFLPVGFRRGGSRGRALWGLWRGGEAATRLDLWSHLWHVARRTTVPLSPTPFTSSDAGGGDVQLCGTAPRLQDARPWVTRTPGSHAGAVGGPAHLWGASCPLSPPHSTFPSRTRQHPHASGLTRCQTACGQIAVTSPCISAHTHIHASLTRTHTRTRTDGSASLGATHIDMFRDPQWGACGKENGGK